MACSRCVARSTAAPPSSRACSSTSAPPRRPGSRSSVSLPWSSSPSSESTSISRPTRLCSARRSRIRPRASPSTPSSASSWRYRSASPSPSTARFSPTASSEALEHLEHLRGALRRRRAEQLDPGVQELADLAPLGADDPVGVADVGEAQGRRGLREAGRHQAGDRDRHVGAQGEQLAALVEEAVGADPAASLAARQHLVVLQRRRRDLAVAEALEDLDQGRLELAKLAHLVRQDVPGARGDRVDHRPIIAFSPSTGCKVLAHRIRV